MSPEGLFLLIIAAIFIIGVVGLARRTRLSRS